jgi:hypothetical protein
MLPLLADARSLPCLAILHRQLPCVPAQVWQLTRGQALQHTSSPFHGAAVTPADSFVHDDDRGSQTGIRNRLGEYEGNSETVRNPFRKTMSRWRCP